MTSNSRLLRLGKHSFSFSCHSVWSKQQLIRDVIFSHVVFLVLDHDRPNPLHHAPIDKSPKVRERCRLWIFTPC